MTARAAIRQGSRTSYSDHANITQCRKTVGLSYVQLFTYAARWQQVSATHVEIEERQFLNGTNHNFLTVITSGHIGCQCYCSTKKQSNYDTLDKLKLSLHYFDLFHTSNDF